MIVGNIKIVVWRLLIFLSSEVIDFIFVLVMYVKLRWMSCFGSVINIISYMDREYNYGDCGIKNFLKWILSRMILK